MFDMGERIHASMEPGHEDREYSGAGNSRPATRAASMESGHEDREYPRDDSHTWTYYA